MKEKKSPDLTVLHRCPLFSGITAGQISEILSCLQCAKRDFPKGTVLYTQGEDISSAGILLTGKLMLFKEDYLGNRMLVSELSPGDLFGESAACLPGVGLPVSIQAASDSSVLFLNYHKILTMCDNACSFHTALIRNMISVMARKNIALNEKLEHLSKRTTREKLLSYLSGQQVLSQAGRTASSGSVSPKQEYFQIPLNRQELADYLCTDRSALSRELGRMRDEGILEFHKNRFRLYL